MPHVEAPTMEATAPEAPALTAEDRCDRCGAQAYVIVGFRGRRLDLCNHHMAEHQDALIGDGWTVILDDRHKLS